MTHADMEGTIRQIFSLALGRPVQAGDDVSMVSEPLWDSIKHIEIIMTLEQEMGVSFEPEDIPKLTTLSSLVAKVKELHAC